jgi:DNA-binding CsgD family transcriptional regulator
MIGLGMTSKKIADELFLSPHTVQTHRKNINFKLQISNPVELTLFAKKQGLIPD